MNRAYLLHYFSCYPHIPPQDVLKLCYQSAFGCRHVLGEPSALADKIAREREKLFPLSQIPPYELLCGGFARLNLNHEGHQKLDGKAIARMMLLSAAQPCGGEAAWAEGLHLVEKLAEEGKAPFSREDFRSAVVAWQKRGGEAPSHTEWYHQNFFPAYRVIRSDFITLHPLICRVDERLKQTGHALVVLDGPCGSGKSTLAALLGAYYGCTPIAMDDFFLPPELRLPARLAVPGGNLHYERFLQEVILPLKRGGGFHYQAFCCGSGKMEPRRYIPCSVTIVEGSYSQHPAFDEAWRELSALRVFVTVEEAQQLARLRLRSPERFSIFTSRWIPLENAYFQAYHRRDCADLILRSLPWEPESCLIN